jgi:hypothetical protein
MTTGAVRHVGGAPGSGLFRRERPASRGLLRGDEHRGDREHDRCEEERESTHDLLLVVPGYRFQVQVPVVRSSWFSSDRI